MMSYDHSKGIDLRKQKEIDAASEYAKHIASALANGNTTNNRSERYKDVYKPNFGVRYYYNHPQPVSPEVEIDMERNFDHYMIGEDNMGVYKIKTISSVEVAMGKANANNSIQYNRQVHKLEIQEQAHYFPWKRKDRTGYGNTSIGKYITVRDPRSGRDVHLMDGEYTETVRWDPDIRCYREIISSRIDGTIYSNKVIPEEQYKAPGHLPGTSNRISEFTHQKVHSYDIVSDPGYSGAYVTDPSKGFNNTSQLKKKDRSNDMMMGYGHLVAEQDLRERMQSTESHDTLLKRKEIYDNAKRKEEFERKRKAIDDDMDFWIL